MLAARVTSFIWTPAGPRSFYYAHGGVEQFATSRILVALTRHARLLGRSGGPDRRSSSPPPGPEVDLRACRGTRPLTARPYSTNYSTNQSSRDGIQRNV